MIDVEENLPHYYFSLFVLVRHNTYSELSCFVNINKLLGFVTVTSSVPQKQVCRYLILQNLIPRYV